MKTDIVYPLRLTRRPNVPLHNDSATKIEAFVNEYFKQNEAAAPLPIDADLIAKELGGHRAHVAAVLINSGIDSFFTIRRGT